MYKILGISDEVTTCEACGKTNLKKTVVLAGESGGAVYFGTDCAAQALMGSKSAKNNKVVSTQAQAVQYAKRIMAVHGAEKAALAVWNKFGFLSEVKGGKLILSGLVPGQMRSVRIAEIEIEESVK